jgi:hypothetical protein
MDIREKIYTPKFRVLHKADLLPKDIHKSKVWISMKPTHP